LALGWLWAKSDSVILSDFLALAVALVELGQNLKQLILNGLLALAVGFGLLLILNGFLALCIFCRRISRLVSVHF
jgi:hypothetical protein